MTESTTSIEILCDMPWARSREEIAYIFKARDLILTAMDLIGQEDLNQLTPSSDRVCLQKPYDTALHLVQRRGGRGMGKRLLSMMLYSSTGPEYF